MKRLRSRHMNWLIKVSKGTWTTTQLSRFSPSAFKSLRLQVHPRTQSLIQSKRFTSMCLVTCFTYCEVEQYKITDLLGQKLSDIGTFIWFKLNSVILITPASATLRSWFSQKEQHSVFVKIKDLSQTALVQDSDLPLPGHVPWARWQIFCLSVSSKRNRILYNVIIIIILLFLLLFLKRNILTS